MSFIRTAQDSEGLQALSDKSRESVELHPLTENAKIIMIWTTAKFTFGRAIPTGARWNMKPNDHHED